MVLFDLEEKSMITEEEKKMLSDARKMPVVYDEDSPELTDEMEQAFLEARRKKPFSSEAKAVYV